LVPFVRVSDLILLATLGAICGIAAAEGIYASFAVEFEPIAPDTGSLGFHLEKQPVTVRKPYRRRFTVVAYARLGVAALRVVKLGHGGCRIRF